MSKTVLHSRRILVVEDEYMIAADMQQDLEEVGAIVLGPAPSVEAALQVLSGEAVVDGAVLDINLNGEKVFPVADTLTARGIPFLFATGYDASNIPPAYVHIIRCEKPVDTATIARALSSDTGAT